MAGFPSSSRTAWEVEIRLIAAGLTNTEIAWGRRVQGPLTCKSHVSRILTKLDARDRTQLVVLAYESGLIVPGQLDGIGTFGGAAFRATPTGRHSCQQDPRPQPAAGHRAGPGLLAARMFGARRIL